LAGGTASFTTSTLTAGSHSITAVYSGDGNFSPSTSNVVTQSVGPPADSAKLKALQTQVTAIVAQTSGAAITGAIDGAINDAFGNGGNPVTFGPNGATFNFTAEPRTEIARRTDEAFAALGYSGNGPNKAPPRISTERVWSVWLDVRGTGWNSTNNPPILGITSSAADFKGTQINVTGGLGYKVTPDFLIGLVAGYENFKYDSVSLTGTMKGNGGTIGGYMAWRIMPTLRWDAALAWSGITYDGVAGTASGSFTGHRWLASTGLTGNYPVWSFAFEPSAKIYALWENENAFTDSLGTLQSAHNFSAGRVATGGKVVYPWLMADGTKISSYFGLYGDWRFSTNNALPAGQPVVGIGDGWSGRVTGGVAFTAARGASLNFGGEYGGLGADYKCGRRTCAACCRSERCPVIGKRRAVMAARYL
jgi:hypothetical protein